MGSLGVAKLYDDRMFDSLPMLREKSVDSLEIGFAPGLPKEFPHSFVERAKGLGLRLSCHLPFSINLGREQDKATSLEYLTKGLKIANVLGGLAVFHPGFYRGHSFGEVRGDLLETLRQTLQNASSGEGKLGVETTGKSAEIGTLDEVLSLIKDLDSKLVVPVIDWAHIFARTQGKFPRTLHDFITVLDRIKSDVAPDRFYFHFSGIEFGKGGERKHTSVKTCTPPLPYLIEAMKQSNIDFQIILESSDPIGDITWARMVLDDPQQWFGFVEDQQRKLQMNLMDAYL